MLLGHIFNSMTPAIFIEFTFAIAYESYFEGSKNKQIIYCQAKRNARKLLIIIVVGTTLIVDFYINNHQRKDMSYVIHNRINTWSPVDFRASFVLHHGRVYSHSAGNCSDYDFTACH